MDEDKPINIGDSMNNFMGESEHEYGPLIVYLLLSKYTINGMDTSLQSYIPTAQNRLGS